LLLCALDEEQITRTKLNPSVSVATGVSKEVNLSQIDVKNIPKDMVMGYGSVEIKLTKILSS